VVMSMAESVRKMLIGKSNLFGMAV
jgi:hypothetical protein